MPPSTVVPPTAATNAASSNFFRVKFSQAFGALLPGETASEDDLINSVEFDQSGDFLATGDNSGRLVMFCKVPRGTSYKYQFYHEFQAHKPMFDSLRSSQVSGALRQLKWCPRPSNAHHILTSNGVVLTLVAVREKSGLLIDKPASALYTGPKSSLQLPKAHRATRQVSVREKHVYAKTGHKDPMHSLAINSDGLTFLTADDYKINLHSLVDAKGDVFTVVDPKSPDYHLEDETEWISCLECHPTKDYLFAFGNSTGHVKLADFRVSAACNTNLQVFGRSSSAVVASVSSVKFGRDGLKMLTRDYMKLRLFDLRMGSKPMEVRSVHEHIRPKLWELYDKEIIYDRFSCATACQGQCIVTGSYSNQLRIFDILQNTEITFDPTNHMATSPSIAYPTVKSPRPQAPAREENFSQGLLHMSTHPTDGVVAVAAGRSLCISSLLTATLRTPPAGARKNKTYHRLESMNLQPDYAPAL
eukprot:TRINITY_DN7757_c0_g1::TRINITY_DN7757_c0_g1_i1::g.8340::m.8340 TRINITY_DN7757_c0_g1::TRINITY_DN7757_c0_g1_i1::g.8340  ORF type:complete len:473 (+),score=76.71,sp/Q5Z8Z7/2ABA_ORYSJ/33.20/3e-71,WD40/PF00400.27/2.8,WD40/PF00400.27/6.6e+03,WD40/PF00400.27/11,WD40/PF00400.27/15,WD40/PF00400.27/7.6e+03,WD40/PF00400.27/1.7 TRINITY_DN7757_c0_g1_i1:110-1528(+)